MKIVSLDNFCLNPGDLDQTIMNSLGEVIFYERTSSDKIVERSLGAQIVITNKVSFDDSTLAQLSDLKMIVVSASGFDMIDTKAARALGILVCNVPAYSTNAVAQLTFALILNYFTQAEQHIQAVRAGAWAKSADWSFSLQTIQELEGKTLGLIGFGHIGQKVAQIGHSFGMRCLYHNRSGAQGEFKTAQFCPEIDTLLVESDVVSLHLPYVYGTAPLVDAVFLKKMKKTGILVNTSRGRLINEAVLAAELRAGTIAAALLDVLSQEPPQADNPLFQAPHCFLTPHIGWASLQSRQRLQLTIFQNIKSFLADNPINVIN
jgi:glycerate dehydrogenase